MGSAEALPALAASAKPRWNCLLDVYRGFRGFLFLAVGDVGRDSVGRDVASLGIADKEFAQMPGRNRILFPLLSPFAL